MNLLATPLGWIMKICYELVSNYGIALFIFTFITRLVVFPLNIKQQKSTARMSMLTPELDKLKKKYKNNPDKLNEETMKLYSKENINPMASCLPMIITLVVLWSLIPVIYGPLTYVSDANKDDIKASNSLISNLYVASKEVKENDTTFEAILQENDFDLEAVADELGSDDYKKTKKLSEADMKSLVEVIEKHPDIDGFMTDEQMVSKSLAESRPELVTFDFVEKADGKYADVLPESVRKAAEDMDYQFLGISLGTIPKWKSWTCLIPIISAVLQLLCTIVSQRFSKKNNTAAASMNGSMKIMLYAMPLFSLWIGFSFPAGLGLYWIYSSLLALVQTIVLNVLYTPDKVKEMVKKDMAKQKKKKKKPSMMEKAIAMQNQQNGTAVTADDDSDDEDAEERKLSKAELKELQRQRLNEARRRMAEKYGDDYSEND